MRSAHALAQAAEYVFLIKDGTTAPVYAFQLFQGKLDMVSTLQELGFSTLKTWVGDPVFGFVPVASAMVDGHMQSVQAFDTIPNSRSAPLRVCQMTGTS